MKKALENRNSLEHEDGNEVQWKKKIDSNP